MPWVIQRCMHKIGAPWQLIPKYKTQSKEFVWSWSHAVMWKGHRWWNMESIRLRLHIYGFWRNHFRFYGKSIYNKLICLKWHKELQKHFLVSSTSQKHSRSPASPQQWTSSHKFEDQGTNHETSVDYAAPSTIQPRSCSSSHLYLQSSERYYPWYEVWEWCGDLKWWKSAFHEAEHTCHFLVA